VLKNSFRLALGREWPITFCLDTKSNKKIKTEKSFSAQGPRWPAFLSPPRSSLQGALEAHASLKAALLRNAIVQSPPCHCER